MGSHAWKQKWGLWHDTFPLLLKYVLMFIIRTGRPFKTGDVVQMTVNMDDKTISYALNGSDLGICHRNVKADEVCPAVTLYKQGDQVTLT